MCIGPLVCVSRKAGALAGQMLWQELTWWQNTSNTSLASVCQCCRSMCPVCLGSQTDFLTSQTDLGSSMRSGVHVSSSWAACACWRCRIAW